MKALTFGTIAVIIFIAGLFYYFFIYKPTLPSQPRIPTVKYYDDVLQVEFKYPPKIFESTSNIPFQIIVKNEGPKPIKNIYIYPNSFPFSVNDAKVINGVCNTEGSENTQSPWKFYCTIEYLDSKDVADIILLISTPEIEEQITYKTYNVILTVGYDYSITKSFTIPLLNEELSKYTTTKPSFSKDEIAPIKIVPEFDLTNEYQTPTQIIRGEWLYANQPFIFNIDFAQKGKIKAEKVKIINNDNNYFYIKVSPATLVKQESFCSIGDIQANSKIKDNSLEFDFSQENFNLVGDGRDFDIELEKYIIMGDIAVTKEKVESVKCTINLNTPSLPEVHPSIEIYLPFTYKFSASTKIRVYNYS